MLVHHLPTDLQTDLDILFLADDTEENLVGSDLHQDAIEYLVFDPTTELLGAPVRAWHATPKGFVAWPARRDGSWQSTVLGVTFKPEGLLLRVAYQDGVIVPTFDELEDELARLRAQRNGHQ